MQFGSAQTESSIGKSRTTLHSNIFSAPSPNIAEHISFPSNSHGTSIPQLETPAEVADIAGTNEPPSRGQPSLDVVETAIGEKYVSHTSSLLAAPIALRDPPSPPVIPAQASYLDYGAISPMTPLSPRPFRRRSVDGGVRIAGGPLGHAANHVEDETQSETGTLPPLYQIHPT